MKRWWDDPQAALDILNAIGDSDVYNGVGAALLGYHSLACATLRPLADQTLVDAEQVRKALDATDLQPVAKALSEATRSIMGDASPRYGELLAEAIHKAATDATERLVTNWTTNGMPWPHAVERAAEVVGVPLERLGRYANLMKAPAVAPLVRADQADRALMEYASALGSREAEVNPELVRKQARNREFREEEHPRDERSGRFTEKKRDDKRLGRLKRVTERKERQDRQRRIADNRAKGKTLVELAKPKLAERKLAERKLAASAAFAKDIKLKRSVSPNPGPGSPPPPPNAVPVRWTTDLYIPISADTLNELRAKSGKMFFASQVTPALKAYSWQAIPQLISEHGGRRRLGYDFYLLKTSNVVIDLNKIEEGLEHEGRSMLDSLAHAPVYPLNQFQIRWDVPETLEIPTKFGENEVFENILWVDVLNDSDIIHKASRFREEEHPRNEDGEFRRKTDAEKRKEARLERRDRLAARNERKARQNRLSDLRRKQQEAAAENRKVRERPKLAQVQLQQRDMKRALRLSDLKLRRPHPKKGGEEPLDVRGKVAYYITALDYERKFGDRFFHEPEDHAAEFMLTQQAFKFPGNGDVPGVDVYSSQDILQKIKEDADERSALSDEVLIDDFSSPAMVERRVAEFSTAQEAIAMGQEELAHRFENHPDLYQNFEVEIEDMGDAWRPKLVEHRDDRSPVVVIASTADLQAVKDGKAEFVFNTKLPTFVTLLRALGEDDPHYVISEIAAGDFKKISNPSLLVFTVKRIR